MQTLPAGPLLEQRPLHGNHLGPAGRATGSGPGPVAAHARRDNQRDAGQDGHLHADGTDAAQPGPQRHRNPQGRARRAQPPPVPAQLLQQHHLRDHADRVLFRAVGPEPARPDCSASHAQDAATADGLRVSSVDAMDVSSEPGDVRNGHAAGVGLGVDILPSQIGVLPRGADAGAGGDADSEYLGLLLLPHHLHPRKRHHLAEHTAVHRHLLAIPRQLLPHLPQVHPQEHHHQRGPQGRERDRHVRALLLALLHQDHRKKERTVHLLAAQKAHQRVRRPRLLLQKQTEPLRHLPQGLREPQNTAPLR